MGRRGSPKASRRGNDGDAESIATEMWAEDALKKWQNPVFKATERRVGSFSVLKPEGRSFASKADHLFANSSAAAEEVEEAISRDELSRMEVLGPVDRKFILCRVPKDGGGGGGMLVVVDQHAVDERVRLERLLGDMYVRDGCAQGKKIDTLSVDPPVRISLTREEMGVAVKGKESVGKWGIGFGVLQSGDANVADRGGSSSSSSSPAYHILVHTLPKVVSDRCCAEPRLVKAVILEAGYEFMRGGSGGGGGGGGGSGVAGMPKGLFAVLCSKACRYAIMFGDVLSLEECKGVIRDLRGCKVSGLYCSF
ncbi:DNA mismatch repair protein [Rhizophlyctis rosea]|nr:DNA mismatch repair protein [Rhizophlyctis rosea]